MKRSVLLCLAILSAAVAGVVLADATDGDADDIGAVLDAQVRGWNERGVDAFMEAYWRSPDMTFHSGTDRVEGWETLRGRYRARYEGKRRGELAFEDVRVVMLAADAAYATGKWRVTTGGEVATGLFTLVFRRFDDGWRIVHDHTS